MLSISLRNLMDKVPNTKYKNLSMTGVDYFYHLFNVISLNLSQIDHIKQVISIISMGRFHFRSLFNFVSFQFVKF